MTHATLNLQTASGHEVLAAAGKKLLRPGGRAATQQLYQWANFQPGETVLELAASFGYSAIALAQQYGVKVIGIEKNPASVARARANVAAAGLTGQVEIIEGNIFHLDQLNETFDYVLAEAILTMQSPAGKARLLADIHDRLKPGGKLLSHELLARQHETELHEILAKTLRVNSTPLPENQWLAAFEKAGLTVQQHKIGAMGLLHPQQMLQDEGWNLFRIGWNLLTHPDLRQRVLQMRQVFTKHQQDLGYIIVCAERQ